MSAESDDNKRIALSEVDEPFSKSEKGDDIQDELKLKIIQTEEKSRKEEHKRKQYYKAFNLIVGCLILLGVVYLVDVVMNAVISGRPSTITESIIEIIKTLLFTLSGYLFAKKDNGD